jgi:beta-lactamase superfamily II metal-dependent hydrolase
MTDWPELVVLDVGHGNCTVVRDGNVVYVVDVPKRPQELVTLLRRYARRHDLRSVDTVVISHADADHVAGVVDLLLDDTLPVRRLFLNADADRSTLTWKAIRIAVADARARTGLDVTVGVTSATSQRLEMPTVRVDVISPSPQLAMSGVGGKTLGGKTLSANSMSTVLRFWTDDAPGVLLAGDLDSIGLDEILDEGPLPTVDVLVYPHHGGRPGGADPGSFARRLTQAAGPNAVVFSVSRERAQLPRMDVVGAVVDVAPGAHVACTQLSQQCAAAVPDADQPHLSGLPGRALTSGGCCAGTLRFEFTDVGLSNAHSAAHQQWVGEHVDTPLCQLPMLDTLETEVAPIPAM